MKILVFTTDMIPLPGLPTSGTALRTFGLAQGLKAHGHDIVFSVPKNAIDGFLKSTDLASLEPATRKAVEELKLRAFDSFNQGDILAHENPDAVLCGHWPAMALRVKPTQPLIVDLAGPHLLERHYQGTADQMAATMAKLAVIATADYFIVSGPSQRLYFLSFMLRAGVPHPERRIIEIPMPLSPELPRPQARAGEFPHFIFGGVFLPWQNPAWGLMRLGEALTQRNQGQLTLIGGKHPNYEIKEGAYAELFDDLGKNPRVRVKPMLPFENFIDELTQADVAVDLMEWNLERQLAVTIRSTTYLWAGLPVIYNDFADLGRLIKSYDAGWLVKPGDNLALSNILSEIYADTNELRTKKENARRLAREHFSWDRAVLPLLAFLRTPETSRPRETDIILDIPETADFSVYRNFALKQRFVCRINGLSRVECRIATHNRVVKNPVTFRLWETQGESDARLRVVAEREARDSGLVNNEWFALEVGPIQDSAGKSYELEISAEDNLKEESISPWGIYASPYPLLGLTYGNRRVPNTALCLRTTCSAGEQES